MNNSLELYIEVLSKLGYSQYNEDKMSILFKKSNIKRGGYDIDYSYIRLYLTSSYKSLSVEGKLFTWFEDEDTYTFIVASCKYGDHYISEDKFCKDYENLIRDIKLDKLI